MALARALAGNPRLLLLDEPLGALDALTRIEMQQLIEQLWLEKQFTVLLVTHDVSEAVALADRVIVIEDGKIGLDLKISLARPREHDSGFAYFEKVILDRLLVKRSYETAKTNAEAFQFSEIENEEIREAYKMAQFDLQLQADVLIIGGGPSGAWAAITAAKEGAKVVLVDKGYCGTSGATAPSGTGLWYVNPTAEEREAAMKSREALGGYLADRGWMKRVLDQTYSNTNQIAAWGTRSLWTKQVLHIGKVCKDLNTCV